MRARPSSSASAAETAAVSAGGGLKIFVAPIAAAGATGGTGGADGAAAGGAEADAAFGASGASGRWRCTIRVAIPNSPISRSESVSSRTRGVESSA